MSVKALERSNQKTKMECCQPDRYRPTMFFHIAKARKRWVELETRLITYKRKYFIIAHWIFARICGDPSDPAFRLLHMPHQQGTLHYTGKNWRLI